MEYEAKHQQAKLLLLLLIFLVMVVLGTALGAVKIPPSTVINVLLQHLPGIGNKLLGAAGADTYETIIWELRFPRVLLAGLVGMCLALSGAAYQGLFKNPMADPHIIGVSQGASLGAGISIVLGTQVNWLGLGTLPIFAFIGAMGTVGIVYFLARVERRVPVMTLLLAGIAVGTLLSALVSLLIFFSGQQLHSIIYWLMGGFSGRSWDYVIMVLPYTLLGAGIILALARELNLLLLGEETAQHLGVKIETVKMLLLAAASLLTAAAVSASGIIGFVGLIIPHAVRILVGPDHRILLPAAALAGAAFLMAADILARILLNPAELPVGIITALFGAPFFIYLLRRSRKAGYYLD